jgi:hypothetical protein
MERRDMAWKVASGTAGMLAGLGARAIVRRIWGVTTDDEPSPVDPRTPWATAIGWTVATGVAVGVARLVAVRGAAKAWEVATDELPPGTTAAA